MCIFGTDSVTVDLTAFLTCLVESLGAEPVDKEG